MKDNPTHDVAIVGGGHNGLVRAAYLARAGLSVKGEGWEGSGAGPPTRDAAAGVGQESSKPLNTLTALTPTSSIA